MRDRPRTIPRTRTAPRCRHGIRALPLLLAIAAAAAAPAAWAQEPPGPGGPLRGERDVQRELFPPELVMRHQAEIGLSGKQKETLVQEMQRLQSDLVPLQFAMAEAAGRLRDALADPRVDEEEALALAERVMSIESQIKRRHLVLLIRIKNTLTPDQQERLRGLRAESPDRPGKRAFGHRP